MLFNMPFGMMQIFAIFVAFVSALSPSLCVNQIIIDRIEVGREAIPDEVASNPFATDSMYHRDRCASFSKITY